MTEMPLFPLGAVLMPFGHMPLQIFERRYVDLVADCMRNNTGFGVAWLRSAAEVATAGRSLPEVGEYGTYGRIVDWDQLDNGLLGITVRGDHKFVIRETWRAESGLMMASVDLQPAPPTVSLAERWQSLAEVLLGLEAHPHVQRMQLSVDYSSAWEVVYTLIQLLPFEESLKYELLSIDSLEELIDELDLLLNQISGETQRSE